MRGFIGEFEELVLLTIACLGKEASYGVAIKEEIEERAKQWTKPSYEAQTGILKKFIAIRDG